MSDTLRTFIGEFGSTMLRFQFDTAKAVDGSREFSKVDVLRGDLKDVDLDQLKEWLKPCMQQLVDEVGLGCDYSFHTGDGVEYWRFAPGVEPRMLGAVQVIAMQRKQEGNN